MTPGQGWKLHDGTPGDASDDFLVPPEPSIGRVISASTNRKEGGFRKPSPAERSIYFGGGCLGSIVGGMAALFLGMFMAEMVSDYLYHLSSDNRTLVGFAFGGAGALFFGLVGVIVGHFMRRPTASWVGELGVQRYTRGLFGPKLEVLRFEEAGELKVQRTRHYTNGVYTGTNYNYTWFDGKGARLFVIAGSFRDGGKLDPREPVLLAYAAEDAWSRFRIHFFDRQIQNEGMARFYAGQNFIGIGKGFVEIGWRGQTERLQRSEMQDIYLQQGQLVIKRQGAREGFFSSDGVFRFPVAQMNDFQVFLIVLKEQTGIQFK